MKCNRQLGIMDQKINAFQQQILEIHKAIDKWRFFLINFACQATNETHGLVDPIQNLAFHVQ